MGMTIDDSKADLTSRLTEIEITGSSMLTSASKDELKVAIDTMRKYQQITEIVTKWHNDLSFKTSMAMTEIEEVIEDGKID